MRTDTRLSQLSSQAACLNQAALCSMPAQWRECLFPWHTVNVWKKSNSWTQFYREYWRAKKARLHELKCVVRVAKASQSKTKLSTNHIYDFTTARLNSIFLAWQSKIKIQSDDSTEGQRDWRGKKNYIFLNRCIRFSQYEEGKVCQRL